MGVRPGYKKTDVGVIPMQWETPRVGEVCGCIVPGRNKPQLFDGDIPWITTPDLEDGKPVTGSRLGLCISRSEAKAVGSKVVPPGSVLMSCAGELGIVALTQNEIVVNQQLHVFLPSERVDAKYLLNALAYQKDRITSLGTKTAVPYLNKSSCNSIAVPLPPLHEQRAIAEALSDTDALLGALDRLIAKKRDLKQAAMQQLLTGQTRLPGFHGKWDVKRLGDVAHIKTGSRNNENKVEDGQYPFFVRSEFVERINSYSLDCEAILVPGEGRIGSIFHYIHGRFDVHQRVYAITQFKPDICGRFVHFYLSKNFGAWAMQNTVKATVDSLRLPTFVTFEMLLPPTIEEQAAIAGALGDMDAELAGLEQRRDKTHHLKQAMMQELLTGRTRLA